MARFTELLDQFFYRPDEDVSGLFELSTAPEELPALLEEEPPGDFLAFALEGETYAVPIRDVREIVKVPPLTEIPRGEPALLGVMNLRGEVIPVYDVKMRLKLTSRPARVAGPPHEVTPLPRSARVVVVHLPDGPSGILVDEVSEVVKMRPSSLEPPPPGIGGERDCVVGLGRRGDKLYILVDVQQALA